MREGSCRRAGAYTRKVAFFPTISYTLKQLENFRAHVKERNQYGHCNITFPLIG